MSSLTEIRDAMKPTIETAIPAIKVYPTIPDVAALPAVVVEPVDTDFSVTMGRGIDTYTFQLIVLVSSGDTDVGQRALDQYVTGAGPKSLRQAVFKAKTLGLPDTNAHISAMTAYNIAYSVVDIQHIAATLRMVVHTKGAE